MEYWYNGKNNINLECDHKLINLVGYTGFVGSNLLEAYKFDKVYNSKNIEESFDTNPEFLIYSGVRAEKFLANENAQKDFEIIETAICNIKTINPKNIVLISTIDIYKNPVDLDEDSPIETQGLHPYGFNRYYLEKWVEDNIKNHLIVRLPGLYGKNIKKNFIFDLINIIPTMLNESKFAELKETNSFIEKYYLNQRNGFYKCKNISDSEKNFLKMSFEKIKFSSLNFTDSRGCFQFYNLIYLWDHINVALKNNIKKINLVTHPLVASELYEYIKGSKFENQISDGFPHYNLKTKYSDLFGGNDGYIFDRSFILEDIKNFVERRI